MLKVSQLHGFNVSGGGDPLFGHVKSVMNFNGNLNDGAGKTWTAFGSPSYSGDGLVFNGSTQYLTTAVSGSNWDVDYTNTCFEWILTKAAHHPVLGGLLDARLGSGFDHYVFTLYNLGGTGDKMDFIANGSGSAIPTVDTRYTGTTIVPNNQLVHVALDIYNGDASFYVDGVREDIGDTNIAPLVPHGTTIYLGTTNDLALKFTGTMRAFRVTSASRYKGASTITPPTWPLPEN